MDIRDLITEINHMHKWGKYISFAIPLLWKIGGEFLNPNNHFSDATYWFYVATICIYFYIFYRFAIFSTAAMRKFQKPLMFGVINSIKVTFPYVLLFIFSGVVASVLAAFFGNNNLYIYDLFVGGIAVLLRATSLFFWNRDYNKAVEKLVI